MSKNKKYRNDSYQKAVPGHGEGVSGADGRGKLEQKCKGGNEKTVSL